MGQQMLSILSFIQKNNNTSCKHNNLFINNNAVKDTKNPRDLNQKTEKK